MEFDIIKNKFEKENTKEKIVCHLFQYRIVWRFVSLDEIINLGEFLSFMEKATATTIPMLLAKEIRKHVIELRNLFKDSDSTVRKYIAEMALEDFDAGVMYKNYLIMYYSNVISYISDPLITYIFYNLIHKNRVINNKEVDVDGMLRYQFYDFNFKIIKLERDILLQLKKRDADFQELYDSKVIVIEKMQHQMEQYRKKLFNNMEDWNDW